MKIISVLILAWPIFVNAQNTLLINGRAPFLKNGTEMSLVQVFPPRSTQLSLKNVVKVVNHIFSFNLKTNGSAYYNLYANGKRTDFLLQPGKATIVISDSLFKQVTIKDNPAATEYDEYYDDFKNDSLIIRYNKARNEHNLYINSKNFDATLANIKLKKRDDFLVASIKQKVFLVLNWIKKHPNSHINTKILYDQIQYIPDDVLKETFLLMPTVIKNNIWGSKLHYIINNLTVNAIAPIFLQTDTNNKQVSLTNFRGKYILLDFWASWCGSCREENPNLVKVMDKFKNKNFEIVGISLDDEKENWIKAIKSDNLNWVQLSDLKGFKNSVVTKYEIFSVPANFLLDPNGKILAKNLYGNELKEALERFIK